MNIKDYLHLYLGCKGMWANGDLTVIDIDRLRPIIMGSFKIKPILRPLSDMTEEEGKYFRTFGSGQNTAIGNPEAWRFLLSKHFDLFGLIDAGVAIDATAAPL